MSLETFPPLLPSELQIFQVDFGTDLTVGETLSTYSVSCEVYSGTDASPSSCVSGAASHVGSTVFQAIQAPASAGNIYQLIWTVTTSLSQVLKRSGLFACIPATP